MNTMDTTVTKRGGSRTKAVLNVADITDMVYLKDYDQLVRMYSEHLQTELVKRIIEESISPHEAALRLYDAWGNNGEVYCSSHRDMFTKEVSALDDTPRVFSSDKCKRCKQERVISYELQLRACDEPSTIFKVCTNCSYTQRM